MGKKDKKITNQAIDNEEEKITNDQKEIKLKSKMYNNDTETVLEKRDDNEDTNNAVMWGFVIGFVLFFILLIIIIVCTK